MNTPIPLKRSGPRGTDPRMLYVPHPFTNWTLNPDHMLDGELQHTVEGFRRTTGHASVTEQLEERAGRPVIWCLGGSSTYCTGLSSWRDSWPALLPDAIRAAGGGGALTVNAGVGGWCSLPSLVRLVTWGPVLRPEIVIVCNTKNDLTPLLCGDQSEDTICPDYQNVMGQFGTVRFGARFWRRAEISMVYGTDHSPAGLQRLDEALTDAILARYTAMADVVGQWGGKVVFLPEFMLASSPYAQPMDELHARLARRARGMRNAVWFEITSVFQPQPDMLQDKMHFTAKGCASYSAVLGSWLASSKLFC